MHKAKVNCSVKRAKESFRTSDEKFRCAVVSLRGQQAYANLFTERISEKEDKPCFVGQSG